jgi:hypothetical protein
MFYALNCFFSKQTNTHMTRLNTHYKVSSQSQGTSDRKKSEKTYFGESSRDGVVTIYHLTKKSPHFHSFFWLDFILQQLHQI